MTTTLQQWANSQANPEVTVNENFASLSHAGCYAMRPAATAGLVWAWYGGRWGGQVVADGSATLAASTTSHMVVNRSTGAVSVSTATTDWNNTAVFARAYRLTTGAATVTAVEDHRAGAGGVHGPAIAAVPQNSQSAAYTLVLADAGRHLLHPSADTTARTFTIPANAAVPYPIGTELTFVNQAGAGALSIAITTDTMRLAGPGTTGTRTLAANGIARALKLTATEWLISGTGLT